jgi:hypothetical protein
MKLKWYGLLGLAIVIGSEVLLFLKVEWVTIWFTPIVWTGYILFVDSLVLRLKGESLIHDRLKEFLMMLWLSIFFWLMFEVYNLFLKNWYYVNLPSQAWQRNLGYGWAFATIFPGIFETTELLEALFPFHRIRRSPFRFSDFSLSLSVVMGVLCVIVPPLLPYPIARYLFGFVWLGFFFLVDPLNMQLGAPSILRDWEEGQPGRTYALLLGGLVCGILWEFWNYWARTKWIYAVPILSEIKIFEMPVLGFLGFPPFAVECYVLYHLARKVLRGEVMWV